MITIKDLEYISVVAEQKSITKAASSLFVVQPALSQCIRKLESELGVKLFDRDMTGVKLTEEGRCFLKFARTTIKNKKMMEKELEDLKDPEKGTVRIGFTGTQAIYVIPYFLPQFHKDHPGIELKLVEGPSDRIEKQILKDEIDIGIIHPPIAVEGLNEFQISEDHMVIIPRSNSKFQKYIYYPDDSTEPYLDIAFLKEEPLALTGVENRSRQVVDTILAKGGIKPVIIQISKNICAVDALACMNYASTIIPEKQISDTARRRGAYHIAPEYDVPYTFNVVWAKNGYVSGAMKLVLERLEKIAGTF